MSSVIFSHISAVVTRQFKSKMKFVILALWCATIVAAADIDSECETPNNEPGTCIPVDRCSEFDFLKTQRGRIPNQTMRLLQTLHCGFMGIDSLICCKSDVPTTTPTPTDEPDVPTRISNIPNVTEHRNIGLINPEFCGLSNIGQRIINGNITGVLEYPWMALLEYRTKTGYKFLCGGTLINVNYVLTAAHCITFTKTMRLVRVRLGEHDYSKEEDCEGEGEDRVCAPPYQSIDVNITVKYPTYSTQMKVDDIGLVRLATPADITQDNVQPICLPVGEESTRKLDNKKMIVSGWGVTETGYLSRVLIKTSLPIVPNEKCKTVFARYNTSLTDNQMCAGGSDLVEDSCKGDSGGPLMRYGIVNYMPSMIQYGIVSFGYMICGTPGIPAVYTRIANYMDWILDNIQP